MGIDACIQSQSLRWWVIRFLDSQSLSPERSEARRGMAHAATLALGSVCEIEIVGAGVAADTAIVVDARQYTLRRLFY